MVLVTSNVLFSSMRVSSSFFFTIFTPASSTDYGISLQIYYVLSLQNRSTGHIRDVLVKLCLGTPLPPSSMGAGRIARVTQEHLTLAPKLQFTEGASKGPYHALQLYQL